VNALLDAQVWHLHEYFRNMIYFLQLKSILCLVLNLPPLGFPKYSHRINWMNMMEEEGPCRCVECGQAFVLVKAYLPPNLEDPNTQSGPEPDHSHL
jgi:hypothetical protein